jgi:hypothetical protein
VAKTGGPLMPAKSAYLEQTEFAPIAAGIGTIIGVLA